MMTSQFGDMETLSEFIDDPVFLLSGLVIGTSFMSMSLLVLELSGNQKYSCLSSTQYLETRIRASYGYQIWQEC